MNPGFSALFPGGLGNLLRQIYILVLLALVPAVMAGIWHPKKPAWSPDALAPGEVLMRSVLELNSPVLWLDARSNADYQHEHIPGALPLNLDEWNEQLPAVLSAWQPGTPIIVYCSSRGCHASHEVAEHLRQVPLPDVYVLKGGWEEWKKAHR